MALTASPQLVTERLDLRVPTVDDLPAVLAIATDPETARFLGSRTRAEHFMRFTRNAGSWLLYGYGAFVVRLRGAREVIGSCGVFHTIRDLGPDFDDMPEAGWIVHRDHTGQGFAYEAMTAALAWFEQVHGLRRVVCLVAPQNVASLSSPPGSASPRCATCASRAAIPSGVRAPALTRG